MKSLQALLSESIDPEFMEWFGDSVVVDEQGEPLVVYHGTNRNFKSFSPEMIGTNFGDRQGFYFIDNPENAKEYGRNIISAYLALENPLEIGTGMIPDTYISRNQDQISDAFDEGYDGVIVFGYGGQRVFVAFFPHQIHIVDSE